MKHKKSGKRVRAPSPGDGANSPPVNTPAAIIKLAEDLLSLHCRAVERVLRAVSAR